MVRTHRGRADDGDLDVGPADDEGEGTVGRRSGRAQGSGREGRARRTPDAPDSSVNPADASQRNALPGRAGSVASAEGDYSFARLTGIRGPGSGIRPPSLESMGQRLVQNWKLATGNWRLTAPPPLHTLPSAGTSKSGCDRRRDCRSVQPPARICRLARTAADRRPAVVNTGASSHPP